MASILTKDLLLRPWQPTDLMALYELGKDTYTAMEAGWQPLKSPFQAQNLLKYFLKHASEWAIVLRANQQVIGTIGLHTDVRSSKKQASEVGYVLLASERRKGYMTQALKALIQHAFVAMDLELLTASHFPENLNSAKLLLNCGFHFTSYRQNAFLRFDGALLPLVNYGLTRSEFLLNKQEEKSQKANDKGFLYTERLLIRPWRYRDAPDLFAYATDPGTGPKAGWKPHAHIGESLGVINQFLVSEFERAIVLDGTVIGSIGFHSFENDTTIDSRDLGYVLSKDYRGHGYAREAVRRVIRYGFETMGLKYITAGYFPGNLASKRVMEAVGMHYFRFRPALVTRYDGVAMDVNEYRIDSLAELKE